MQKKPILSKTLLNYVREISSLEAAGSRIAGPTYGKMARQIARVVRNGTAARNRALTQTGISVPEMCFFSVTWRCDLQCAGCYARSLPTEHNLTPEEISAVLTQTTAAGTVLYAIAGGEPLQVPGLLDILAAAEGGVYMLFTNSTLLDKAAAQTIARAGNILPVLSVEGDARETDLRRGAGISDAVSKAMTNLTAERVPFAFSTMVSHRNLTWVTSRQYVQSLWEAGARFGFFVDYIPIPQSYDPDLVLTPADITCRRNAIDERAAERRPLVASFPEGEYRSGGCMSAGNGFVHIGANGDVEPCTFSHYSTHNLRTSTYLEALDSPFFRKIRETFADRPNPTGSCMLFQNDAEVAEIAEDYGAQCTSSASSPATLAYAD